MPLELLEELEDELELDDELDDELEEELEDDELLDEVPVGEASPPPHAVRRETMTSANKCRNFMIKRPQAFFVSAICDKSR